MVSCCEFDVMRCWVRKIGLLFVCCGVVPRGGMHCIRPVIVFLVTCREFVLKLHDEDGLPMEGKCMHANTGTHTRTRTHINACKNTRTQSK